VINKQRWVVDCVKGVDRGRLAGVTPLTLAQGTQGKGISRHLSNRGPTAPQKSQISKVLSPTLYVLRTTLSELWFEGEFKQLCPLLWLYRDLIWSLITPGIFMTMGLYGSAEEDREHRENVNDCKIVRGLINWEHRENVKDCKIVREFHDLCFSNYLIFKKFKDSIDRGHIQAQKQSYANITYW